MGQGGVVVLVNGTPYDWKLVDYHSYQMEWEFARDAGVVPAYSARSAYVEAKETLFSRSGDDSGEAKYQLQGTEFTFEIQAQYLNLQVQMTGIHTKTASQGSTVKLGMISDRPSYFVLSGKDGDFSSVGDVHDWMEKNMYKLGDRKLRNICVPSSHDSGMSKVPYSTMFAAAGSIVTQIFDVESQLKAGVRYFDLRPVLHREQWSCGHYTFIPKNEWANPPPFDTWQGGNGETVREIVEGVNRFTSTSRELIVISISHTKFIHDLPIHYNDAFVDLTGDQWSQLLDTLTGTDGIKALWKPENGVSTASLTDLTLGTFIKGAPAVVLIFDDGVDVSGRSGCFNSGSWTWSASAWDKSEDDRINDFRNHASQPNAAPYSFSGCHTQSTAEAIATTLGQTSQSVLALSKAPKDKLFRELFPICTEKTYPAAISMDAIDSSDLTALAIAINDRIEA